MDYSYNVILSGDAVMGYFQANFLRITYFLRIILNNLRTVEL